MNPEIRVRFAPSPTGYLHVGGARTALFNWLFARHHGGTFVLRIEDTDKARNTQEAVQVILDGLRWLGLDWTEGPEKDGAHGPYFQSQREHLYEKYFQQLLASGHLYEDAGAWRFRSLREVVVVDDIVCGRIEFDLSNPETHPDMTIRRPDGSWIFHFVNVVDDIEMRISHVIRGEDHLSNTPKHLELFKALGCQAPQYAHIPLILNKDGSKMSKRDAGASITGYIEAGYAPEAVRNYLSLLGWSPKDDREFLEIEETIRLFDLSKVNRKNAHFDLDKCLWLNTQHLSKTPLERYRQMCLPFIQKAGILFGAPETLDPVLTLVREKVKVLSEIPAWITYFYTEDYTFEPEAVRKAFSTPVAAERLAKLTAAFEGLSEWNAVNIEAILKQTATELGAKPNELLLPTRVSVSGRASGPNLFPMLEVLGRERTVARIRHALATQAPVNP
ncbi:MAG: glutamyl-tRNA synthetase [Verrucomicrobia bacterium]|nr:MAG: glutamyl-tRNA synthetase [Verrucomicrobiota bacterium]